jgi:hypothetical protein
MRSLTLYLLAAAGSLACTIASSGIDSLIGYRYPSVAPSFATIAHDLSVYLLGYASGLGVWLLLTLAVRKRSAPPSR